MLSEVAVCYVKFYLIIKLKEVYGSKVAFSPKGLGWIGFHCTYTKLKESQHLQLNYKKTLNKMYLYKLSTKKTPT